MIPGATQVEVVKVITPELVLNNIRRYAAVKGALVKSSQVFPASNVTNSSIQITCTPPSADIAISRNVMKRFTYMVTIAGTNTSGSPTLLQSGAIAPRLWPIMSSTVSESMTINNTTVTQSPVNNMWPALLHYNDCFCIRNGVHSPASSSFDKYQNYADGFGAYNNPLNSYTGSPFEMGRAAANFSIITNGATGATVFIESVEPILLSPFVFGEESFDTPALIGVNTMTYYAVLGNLSRVISLIPNQGVTGINITSVTTQVLTAQLEFFYLTPDVLENIPRHLVTSYYSITNYPTQVNQTVLPGQTVSVNMSSVQFPGIPKRVIIYCGNSPGTYTNDTIGALSDVYMSFAQNGPLTVTWNNNQFLSSATQEQLYEISVKNGCNDSWAQWAGQIAPGLTGGASVIAGRIGSILVLSFGDDIGLGPTECAGKMGNYQFSISANFLNTNTTTSIVNPQLSVIAVFEGIFEVNNGACSANINVLTDAEVLQAKALPGVKYMPSKNVYGGLFEGFANFLSNANKFLKDTKLLSTIGSLIPIPGVQVGAQVANQLGYGRKRRGGRSLQQRIRGAGLNSEQDDQNEYSDDDYYNH